ncbi:hypothetical protein, partial [Actinomadura sp. HBU206391]|uniref:hypothetical protein n=1 Tax=Actinomadura sp. HBU206391 TaxID=2731692 RepID=UPI001C9CB64C
MKVKPPMARPPAECDIRPFRVMTRYACPVRQRPARPSPAARQADMVIAKIRWGQLVAFTPYVTIGAVAVALSALALRRRWAASAALVVAGPPDRGPPVQRPRPSHDRPSRHVRRAHIARLWTRVIVSLRSR